MLILRRSNCMYTAYGIVTLSEWPWWSYSTQVETEQRNLCIKLVNGIKFIFSCDLSGCTIVFHIIPQSPRFSKKMLPNKKLVFGFLPQLLSGTFFILRRTERNMIKNINWSSHNVSVILVPF